MRYWIAAVLLFALAACGDSTGPAPEWINISGEYVAASVDGETLPVRVGTFECEGAEADLYLLDLTVGLYDNDSDPEAEDRVYRARKTGARDGDCWTKVLAWGTYQARGDTLIFHWPGAVPIEGGSWTDQPFAFDAPTPDGVASFDFMSPVPAPVRP